MKNIDDFIEIVIEQGFFSRLFSKFKSQPKVSGKATPVKSEPKKADPDYKKWKEAGGRTQFIDVPKKPPVPKKGLYEPGPGGKGQTVTHFLDVSKKKTIPKHPFPIIGRTQGKKEITPYDWGKTDEERKRRIEKMKHFSKQSEKAGQKMLTVTTRGETTKVPRTVPPGAKRQYPGLERKYKK